MKISRRLFFGIMAGAIASPAIARTEQSPTIVKINYIPDGWVRMEKMTTANHTHYLTTAQIPPHTHTLDGAQWIEKN